MESACTRKGTGGSNPPLSAIFSAGRKNSGRCPERADTEQEKSERSSVVELDLAKVVVESSNLFARSTLKAGSRFWNRPFLCSVLLGFSLLLFGLNPWESASIPPGFQPRLGEQPSAFIFEEEARSLGGSWLQKRVGARGQADIVVPRSGTDAGKEVDFPSFGNQMTMILKSWGPDWSQR